MSDPMLTALAVKRPRETDGPTTDPKQWTNVLAEVPLFAALSKRHLRKVAAAAQIRRFHNGAALMRQGEPGEALHVLLDGKVAVLPPGRPAVRLGIGSFVGELALLDGGPRTATVIADGAVVALTIPRTRFRKLLLSEPSLAVAVAGELAQRLRAAQAVG